LSAVEPYTPETKNKRHSRAARPKWLAGEPRLPGAERSLRSTSTACHLLPPGAACEEQIEYILLVHDYGGRGVLQAEDSRAVNGARLQDLLRGGRCEARQRSYYESAGGGSYSGSPEERTAEKGAAAARHRHAAQRRRREGAVCEGQREHLGEHFPGNLFSVKSANNNSHNRHQRTTVATRSLLSRSRVDWAIEAARRVFR